MRGNSKRTLQGLCLLLLACLLTSGCKTWSYTAHHRGIRTIVYNPTNVPIDNIDLDSPFFAPQTAFGTNEQPAIVIIGMTGRVRLGVFNLQTGKKVAEKRVRLNWSSVTIQPLEIGKSGEYKAYFDWPDNERTSYRFSVARASSQTHPALTNMPPIAPLRINAMRLGLDPKNARKNFDALFVPSVQQSWYSQVDDAPLNIRGVVTLRFWLHADGHFSDLKVIKNTAGERGAHLCEQALEQMPPRPWPESVRNQIGKDSREIQFTFYY